ncbi:MAG: rhodanese-like domain-containing protein [Planctomycetota bacterium]|nr:rhodanese-like domain-containing protein [Planctomycetota bacterium]
MELGAILVAVGAFLVGFVALRAAGNARRAADEAKEDARRRTDAVLGQVENRLTETRRLLALVASGAKLDREQILEGRLWREIDAREAQALVAAGSVRVLDVRNPNETAFGIIPGAQILPVDALEERHREVARTGKPLLVYCAAGARSAAACEFLSAQGYDELINLAGGFQSWTGPRAKPGA